MCHCQAHKTIAAPSLARQACFVARCIQATASTVDTVAHCVYVCTRHQDMPDGVLLCCQTGMTFTAVQRQQATSANKIVRRSGKLLPSSEAQLIYPVPRSQQRLQVVPVGAQNAVWQPGVHHAQRAAAIAGAGGGGQQTAQQPPAARRVLPVGAGVQRLRRCGPQLGLPAAPQPGSHRAAGCCSITCARHLSWLNLRGVAQQKLATGADESALQVTGPGLDYSMPRNAIQHMLMAQWTTFDVEHNEGPRTIEHRAATLQLLA